MGDAVRPRRVPSHLSRASVERVRDQRADPRGRPYFWFGLDDIEHTLDQGTDLEAVSAGYIAVTPLQLDLTHHPSIGSLAERYAA